MVFSISRRVSRKTRKKRSLQDCGRNFSSGYHPPPSWTYSFLSRRFIILLLSTFLKTIASRLFFISLTKSCDSLRISFIVGEISIFHTVFIALRAITATIKILSWINISYFTCMKMPFLHLHQDWDVWGGGKSLNELLSIRRVIDNDLDIS